MQGPPSESPSSGEASPSSGEFGMTEQDVKNYKYQSFLGKIRYYAAAITPAAIRILNAVIYYSLKFIKAVVVSTIRMIMGKEV